MKKIANKEHVDGEERPCSESTAVTQACKIKNKNDTVETPFRKLSVSNFEPIQPQNLTKTKSMGLKDTLPIYGTPQPSRTESMVFNQFVFK